MPVIDLRPGEILSIRVHSDHLPPVFYLLSIPSFGQDDGWGGNILIGLDQGDLVAVGGEDVYTDFGDPVEQDQISGNVIRIAPEAV